jgi:dihydropyrimidine dehydrogenase (NAD+) subunit PreA
MLKLKEEAAKCMLCAEPPCTHACLKGFDPAAMVRSVFFENEENAAGHIDKARCALCGGDCEKACIHYDRAVRIREMAEKLPDAEKKHADISIDFCGIKCENPFFLSSSVIASGYEMCAKALKAGWAGLVYKTIGYFMPKEASPRFASAVETAGSHFEGFRNIEQISEHTVEYDMDVLRRLKRDFPSKVIVASIMGSTDEEWEALARLSTEAGCDMIECNFSCPHMTAKGLGADIGTDPEMVARYTKIVKKASGIPVLAKMTPNITNMEIPALAAAESGADGIAAINTIKSLTGFDLSEMSSQPSVNGRSSVSGYSGNAVKPIALRFIYDMASCGKLRKVPLSGIGGIQTWRDAADFIAIGCANVQVTTAVMQYGYRL